jgi:methionine salvage enolase-phosphatase E1
MKFFGLDKMPYPVFSLKHSPEKSSSEYYKIFLKEQGLKADEVIYFEHNNEAVESAKSVGILTFHYDKEKKDLNLLEKFLKENA